MLYTLDSSSKYWQIEVDNRDKEKTAFMSHHGLYRFMRFPFGLINTLTALERTVDVILGSVWLHFTLISSEDIVVF